MKRIDILNKIFKDINENDIVIACTGYISREIFAHFDRPLNFYMMGSMGNALAIGMGLALNINQMVIVINGDGSALMGLGAMVTAKRLRLFNLIHYILDNNAHESTGGQRTNSHLIDFRHLYGNTIVYQMDKENPEPPRITLEPKQITERFKNALLCQQKQP